MGTAIFYAKSKRPDGSKPTVAEHLDAVAKWAAVYGEAAGISAQARLAGQIHDFGKYSAAFQDVLCGKRQNVDHASCGAAALLGIWKGNPRGSKMAVIEAVNGHHDGLKDLLALKPLLLDSLRGTPYLTINNGKTPALSGPEEYQKAMKQFCAEHPNERFSLPGWALPDRAENLETMLYTRMLFSCLVDADYSVSAWEEDHNYFHNADAPPLDIRQCLDKLYAFRDNIRANSSADTQVNQVRDLVFDRCGNCGETASSGLFTLAAPTGTGKTLALLHFALRHAMAHGKQRIIIVLPFLTLAEQNEATYAEIMPSVLVDHSQSRLGEEMREFAAKWNTPFIITTSVKFFESLFSDQPSDCRKLHNLANSVVVFDEAQSLPLHLTTATLKAVNELCARYQTTMLFSTATQPSFDAIPDLPWTPTEILPDNDSLYARLCRVDVDWRLDQQTPLHNIAEEMLKQNNVCGIFNLRRHARTVFDRLQLGDTETAFLISTDLCPAHRTQVVTQIKERQLAGKSCRVASTQCIEAGVDLDFQALYRALAPLDGIIQAAGRCNRNGKIGKGQMTVFEPDEPRLYPDDSYRNAANIVKQLVKGGGIRIDDPRDIRRYYTMLFPLMHDKEELSKAIDCRDFAEVARQYRLIEKAGEKLIVPYSAERKNIKPCVQSC